MTRKLLSVLLAALMLGIFVSCQPTSDANGPDIDDTISTDMGEAVALADRFEGTICKLGEGLIEVYTEDARMFEKAGTYYYVYLPHGDSSANYIVGDRVAVEFYGEPTRAVIKGTVSVSLVKESRYILQMSENTAFFDASVIEVDADNNTVRVSVLDSGDSMILSTARFGNMDFCVGDVLKVTYDVDRGLPSSDGILDPVLLRYRIRKETNVEMEAQILEIMDDGMRILGEGERYEKEFYLLTENASDYTIGERIGLQFSYRGEEDAPYRIRATFWSLSPVSNDHYTVWARLTFVNPATGWVDAGAYLYYQMIGEYAPYRGSEVIPYSVTPGFFKEALSLQYPDTVLLEEFSAGDYVELTFSPYRSYPENFDFRFGFCAGEVFDCVGISIRRLTDAEKAEVYRETEISAKYLGENEREYSFDVDGAVYYVSKAALKETMPTTFRYGDAVQIVTDGIFVLRVYAQTDEPSTVACLSLSD